MGIDKMRVKQHFDRSAHQYDRYATVQQHMADVLAGLVQESFRFRGLPGNAAGFGAAGVRSILEIGCGTGGLTVRLAEAFPEAQLLCIDLSQRMVEQAQTRLGALKPAPSSPVSSALEPQPVLPSASCWIAASQPGLHAAQEVQAKSPWDNQTAGRDCLRVAQAVPGGSVQDRTDANVFVPALSRISFLVGDAEELLLPGGVVERWLAESEHRFDLIVSNAAFQWFTEPKRTIQACVRLLDSEGGLLAFSTFGPSTFWQLHASFREAERRLSLEPAPHGQSFAGQSEWEAMFSAEEGSLQWSGERVTERFPDVRTFLHSVKRIGAGNAMAAVAQGIGGRRLLETMEQLYAKRYACGSGDIEADYELGFGLFERRSGCQLLR